MRRSSIALSVIAVLLFAALLIRGGETLHAPAPLPATDAAPDPALVAVETADADGFSAPLLPAAPTAHDAAPAPGADATPEALRDGRPLTVSHPAVRAAIAIQERHGDLLDLPGVVATAIGLSDAGALALHVHVKGEVEGLPESIDGLPVLIRRTGEIRARDEARATVGTTSTTSRIRPAPIGLSTGHPDITAGTIGCRVTKNGLVYALSNNHVYADENRASVGDPAWQPGAYDGGGVNDAIGTLAEFVRLSFGNSRRTPKNAMDAAIALSHPDNLGSATPAGGYGLPGTAPAEAALNQAVTKVGRTTGQTFGKVTGLNAASAVQYDQGIARFENQIIVEPGSFSAGGDSGSLIVADAVVRSPVGLLFAGSSATTIASPIGAVLGAFGVEMDAEGNRTPWVGISSPASGASLPAGPATFTGTAADAEDGDLAASIVWANATAPDATLGTGSSASLTLSAGTHTILAKATDSAGNTFARSVQVTVSSGGTPSGSVRVTTPAGTAGYSISGNGKNLNVTVTLKDSADGPVAGAAVAIRLSNGSQAWTASASTGSGGTVAFMLRNAPSGVYTTLVLNVTAAGLTWDGVTPANAFPK